MDVRLAVGKFKSITGLSASFDGLLSVTTGQLHVDIIAFDDMLAAHDPEYDNVECTYKGKAGYSCADYIKEKWGEEAFQYAEAFLFPTKVKKEA